MADGRLEFGILGPLEVRVDGVSVQVGGPKQRALLALLLLSANRVVSRDRLVEELEGGQTGEAADRALTVQVSRLRKALGVTGGARARLVARPPGYVLRVEPGELDLDRFERCLTEGRQALNKGDAGRAADLLGAGLTLWRGRPLADLEFEPFARVDVERLGELHLAAVEERIEAELALGRHAMLVPELEGLVGEHPLRERLRSQLMLALYRCGRQADALEAYRSGRTLLADELALDPSPQLRELEQAILRQDSALSPRLATGPVVATSANEQTPVTDAIPSGPAPRSPRLTRRRWWVIAGAVALGLGLGVGLGPGGSRASVRVRGDALALVLPASGQVRAVVPLQASPSGEAVGFGSVWVTQYGADSVTRVDLRSRSARQTIPVGNGPVGIATAAAAVWIGNTLGNTVSRIDPSTDTVVQTIPVGHQPSALIAAGGSVWVANRGDGTVSRLNPQTGRPMAVVRVGAGPSGLAATKDVLWVSNEDAGTLTRIDAHTGAVVDTVTVGDAPSAIAVARGGVWVLDRLDSTLTRIDPRTDSVAATIPTGGSPSGLVILDGSVWLTNQSMGLVLRVDPHRLSVTRLTAVGERPGALAASAGSLWVGVAAAGRSHRGGTLRVLTAITGVLPIDPAESAVFSATELLGMTNDGLVSLDHVAGPDGDRLVPDLALSLPAPADGGRSYQFRLRPGIRYSTGGTVTPSDVLRSFERLFELRSPGIGVFEDLVGARACARHARCDLSQGIVTNDRAMTVAFHLTQPDPDFLYKLTEQYGYVLPATAPDTLAHSPLPATGPYKIASYAPGRELRLVRNSRFREWSAAAQPDGYPDRISWNLQSAPPKDVTMIERGQADLMSNLAAPPQGEREQLRLHFSSRLHVNAWMTTNFWALNTRAKPFNDVRVRRALNYAIDRSTIAKIYGGREIAQPTCQILPAQIPGFQRYCPYTRDPSPSGRWRGADLQLAHRLVNESGTKGMSVTVWDTPDPAAVVGEGRYVTSVLRSLGYRASLRFLDDQHIFQYTNDSLNHAQIIPGGWVADYPSASDFIGKLTCSNFTPGNASSTDDSSELCNPTLDRQIARADALQASNPSASESAWAHLDRELTNLAIWLPTVTNKTTDIVSSRVGNYQYNPLWGPMYDQLWVR